MRIKQIKILLEKALINESKLKEIINKREVLLKLRRSELALTEQKMTEYKKLINTQKGINKYE